ncbi:hypothetical protein N2152v2_009951 [Parachlorella kessleri]
MKELRNSLSAAAAAAVLLLSCLASGQTEQAPALPDPLSGVISQRAAEADKTRADLQAQLDAAAKVAADLAKQPPASLPTVQPQGNASYVDLSALPSSGGLATQALPQALNFEAVGSYPRMPAARSPPKPLLLTACPESNSVRRYGARGDNNNNDAGALVAAAAKLPFVYLPPGNYRMKKSVTINKPIMAGSGAQIWIDRGVTLTLTQRVQKWDTGSALFAGEGQVRFAGAADEVRHIWFKNPGESDSVAAQQAIDSCAGTCTLVISGPLVLTKAVYLRANVGVYSTNGATLVGNGGGSAGQGFILRPGKYVRPLMFGTMWQFSSFAIKVQGGVTGAEIQVNSMLQCGDGIVFAPNEGNQRTINNVFVTHLTATNAVQNTVVLQANKGSDRLQNCVVRGNFIVSPGFDRPSQQSAAVAVKGTAAPTLLSTSFVFQALDSTQFAKPTTFAMLVNNVNRPVTNLNFKVESWGGGLTSAAGGKLIKGQFQSLRFLARMSGGIPDSQFMAGIGGPTNFVTTWGVASAGWELPIPTTPNRGAFNGGQTVIEQVHYLSAPISGTWGPGQTRTYYIYNAYARTAGGRIKCIPFRAGNGGLTCSKIENQSGRGDGQIAITLKNAAAYALPSWQTSHRFGIQVGP